MFRRKVRNRRGGGIVCSTLALAMVVQLATPALAVTSKTEVTVTIGDPSPDILSATVPAEIPLHLSLDGKVTVPTNLAIVNNVQDKAIKVSSVDVELNSPWEAADFSDDFDAKDIDSKDFSIKMVGDTLDATGQFDITPDNWNIDAGGSLALDVDAKLARQSAESAKQSVATISFNLDWADIIVDNSYTIDVEEVEHCTISLNTVKTDNDGVIIELPDVVPDEGYEFIKWVNSDTLEEINIGDILDADIHIKPIIGVIPPQEIAITFEAESNGRFSVTTPDTNFIVTKGTKFSDIDKPKPISNTNDYMFDKWVDGSGTEITDNTVLTDSTAITARFKIDTATPTQLLMEDKELAGYVAGSDTWDISERFIKNGVEYKVTSVKGIYDEQIKHIILPDTLESLGYGDVFTNSLESLVLPLHLKSFQPGSVITSSDIETSLELDPDNTSFKVENDILYSKDGSTLIFCPRGKVLKEFNVPSGVVDIKSRAFEHVTHIEEINTNPELRYIGDRAFGSCTSIRKFTLLDGVQNIGVNAFQSCVNLTDIYLPNTLTSLGAGAFSYSGLTSVTIPSSIGAIEPETFTACRSLKTVVIGNGITRIGKMSGSSFGSFEECRSLSSINIPSSITTLGQYLFNNCTTLNLSVLSTVTLIGGDAFRNLPYVSYHGTASGSPWGAKSYN